MLYAAAAFWILFAMLIAWAVDRIWGSMADPKTLRALLFPGTAIVQIGQLLGFLITGANVAKSSASGGKNGAGGKSGVFDWEPKMPIIGPIVVAFLPLVLLSLVICLVAVHLGTPVLTLLPAETVSADLPQTLSGFWEQVRGLVSLCEGTLEALRTAELEGWKRLLFAYLMACLTVRLAPLPGNLRGHLGAVAVAGTTAALAGTVAPPLPGLIQSAWPLLALAVGWLLILLLGSLLLRGMVSSARLILKSD